MCQRHLFDSIFSFIGAWLLFILTLSLFYWIACFANKHYVKKHSIYSSRDFFQPFNELSWSYWYRR